jgi:hypothetical protein
MSQAHVGWVIRCGSQAQGEDHYSCLSESSQVVGNSVVAAIAFTLWEEKVAENHLDGIFRQYSYPYLYFDLGLSQLIAHGRELTVYISVSSKLDRLPLLFLLFFSSWRMK